MPDSVDISMYEYLSVYVFVRARCAQKRHTYGTYTICVLKFAKWPNAFFVRFFFFFEDNIMLFRWKRYHNQFAQCFVAMNRTKLNCCCMYSLYKERREHKRRELRTKYKLAVKRCPKISIYIF